MGNIDMQTVKKLLLATWVVVGLIFVAIGFLFVWWGKDPINYFVAGVIILLVTLVVIWVDEHLSRRSLEKSCENCAKKSLDSR